MLHGKSIAVIVPTYNEEKYIGAVIQSMSAFVDRIIIINDGSSDNTENIVTALMDSGHNTPVYLQNTQIQDPKIVGLLSGHIKSAHLPDYDLIVKDIVSSRIVMIRHKKNSGKGAGIKSGYRYCQILGIDCVATMDGDHQMNPEELENICAPVICEGVDYVKGNRLSHPEAWEIIPTVRIYGNFVLSFITKPASGYWKLSDTQTGFNAISKKALSLINTEKIYSYYGYPNDILVKLNIENCTLREVDVKPIYNQFNESKMRIHKVVPKITWLLFSSFIRRIWIKYWVRGFHPLLLWYFLFLFLFINSIALLTGVIVYALVKQRVNHIGALLLLISVLSSILTFVVAAVKEREISKHLIR